MFLLRTGFWILVLILLIPAVPETEVSSEESQTAEAETISLVGGVVSTTRGVLADLSGICERQPKICDTGVEIAAVLKRKFIYSYNFVSNFFEEQKTGEMLQAPYAETTDPDTLKPGDRHANWESQIDRRNGESHRGT